MRFSLLLHELHFLFSGSFEYGLKQIHAHKIYESKRCLKHTGKLCKFILPAIDDIAFLSTSLPMLNFVKYIYIYVCILQSHKLKS